MENQEATPENFSLIELIKVIWKRKWLIVIGTLVIAILTFAITTFKPKVYRGLAEISVSEFKKFRRIDPTVNRLHTGLTLLEYNAFKDQFKFLSSFKKYLNMNGYNLTWEDDYSLLSEFIRPIFAFPRTKRTNKVTENFVVSINLSVDGATPEEAREKTFYLAKYARTLLMNMKLDVYFGLMKNQLSMGNTSLERSIIKLESKIIELKDKESFIEKKILTIPGATQLVGNSTEMSSATEDNEKYLTPVQQLVATRIVLKESEIKIKRYREIIESNNVLLKYRETLASFLDDKGEYVHKEGLLEKLEAHTEVFFKGKTSAVYTQSYYTLKVELSKYRKLSDIFQFISPTPLPVILRGLSRKVTMIFVPTVGFLFLIFLSLALEWWRRNREIVLK
jgi:LPS O-antigen subunit length determinant protein (WzzB/FepE family)